MVTKKMNKNDPQNITPEMMRDLLITLQNSELETADILAYQMAILQGTLTYEMYVEIQEKMHQQLETQEQSIAELEQEIAELEQQQLEIEEIINQQTPEAANELESLRKAFVEAKVQEMEGSMVSSDAEKVEALRSQLNQKHEK